MAVYGGLSPSCGGGSARSPAEVGRCMPPQDVPRATKTWELADASRIIDPGRSGPRARAPEPRTGGAEGPNASAEGRVEALAPEESDTKPSTWHRGSTEGVSTTCPVDVRATCSALPRFEKKTSHGRMVGVCDSSEYGPSARLWHRVYDTGSVSPSVPPSIPTPKTSHDNTCAHGT